MRARYLSLVLALLMLTAATALIAAQEPEPGAAQTVAPAPVPDVTPPVFPPFEVGGRYDLVYGSGRLPTVHATILEIGANGWVRAEAGDREIWLNVNLAAMVHPSDPETADEAEPGPRSGRRHRKQQ